MHFHFYIFALTRTELNLIPDEPDFEIIGIAAAAVVGRADLRLGLAEFIPGRIKGQLCGYNRHNNLNKRLHLINVSLWRLRVSRNFLCLTTRKTIQSNLLSPDNGSIHLLVQYLTGPILQYHMVKICLLMGQSDYWFNIRLVPPWNL